MDSGQIFRKKEARRERETRIQKTRALNWEAEVTSGLGHKEGFMEEAARGGWAFALFCRGDLRRRPMERGLRPRGCRWHGWTGQEAELPARDRHGNPRQPAGGVAGRAQAARREPRALCVCVASWCTRPQS